MNARLYFLRDYLVEVVSISQEHFSYFSLIEISWCFQRIHLGFKLNLPLQLLMYKKEINRLMMWQYLDYQF